MKEFPTDHVFLNSPVQRIENNASGRVVLYLEDGRKDTFDHIILGTHGDQALSILGYSATQEERSVLSCFKTSQKHMPQRRNACCSWNYMTLSPQSEAYTDMVSLTYNMNTLQHIPEDKFGHILVKLNPLCQPDPALTQGRFLYTHPLYTSNAIQAQKQLRHIQNKRGISYAGAWTNYGFYEDGYSSGLQPAQDYLGAKLPFNFVDSTLSRGKKPKLGIVDYFLRLIVTLIQVFVVQSLELLAGIKRQPVDKRPLKAVMLKQS
jgi:predicted NAD/FAD-binding protein